MPKTDLDQTWSAIEGDMRELARPLFDGLANDLKVEDAVKGKVTFEIDVRFNEKTKDYTVLCRAKMSSSGNGIAHKAQLEGRQLILFDTRGAKA